MIETKRKEELSMSYLNAVCAYAGIAMEHQRHDDDGVDVVLKKKFFEPHRYEASINVQLKSTSQKVVTDEKGIHYPLKVKNYNDFTTKTACSKILCVLVLPELEENWLNVSAEELVLRKCMYWLKPDWTKISENSGTETVYIPEKNIVTPETMTDLLKKECEKLQVKG